MLRKLWHCIFTYWCGSPHDLFHLESWNLLSNSNVWTNVRVGITASHLANFEVNSSYCDRKVVNHTKLATQFLSQGKFNSSKLYFPLLYPCFTNPLHTIIAYTQNSTTKCKKCFANFCLRQVKSLATLGIFIEKWISNDNLNPEYIIHKNLRKKLISVFETWLSKT